MRQPSPQIQIRDWLGGLGAAWLLASLAACSGSGPMEDSQSSEAAETAQGTVAQITIERESVAQPATQTRPSESDTAAPGAADPGAAAPPGAVDPSAADPAAADRAAVDPAAVDPAAVVANPELTNLNDTPVATEQEQGAHALAHYVSIRATSRVALEAAGLEERLPAIDECTTEFDYSATALTSLEPLELVDGGSVIIRPEGRTQSVELAPHAFPSVSSFAAGVVYTTRDRSPSALPGGVPYTILLHNTDSASGLKLNAEAPKDLSEVTLGGLPLAQVVSVSRSEPLDVTWEVGSPEDVVYMDIVSDLDGQPQVRCSFVDAGSGSIPQEALSQVSPGTMQFVIHRQRALVSPVDSSTQLDSEDASQSIVEARLRFDFELSHRLRLTQ